jgi:hypothetical protein
MTERRLHVKKGQTQRHARASQTANKKVNAMESRGLESSLEPWQLTLSVQNRIPPGHSDRLSSIKLDQEKKSRQLSYRYRDTWDQQLELKVRTTDIGTFNQCTYWVLLVQIVEWPETLVREKTSEKHYRKILMNISGFTHLVVTATGLVDS